MPDVSVLAHDTGSAGPAGPLLLAAGALGVALAAAWYACGSRVLLRAGRGSGWRTAACVAGAAVTVAMALPAVERLAESRLATHMTQHMLLIVVAAPLLALGAPGRAVWVGLPRSGRARLVRWLHRPGVRAVRETLLLPAVAWCLHVGVLWLWHLPAAYDAALHSPVLHAAEHATFLGTAWLFWWHALTPSRRRLSQPFAALYVATAMLPSAALGAVLTFAPVPLYPGQSAAATAGGVDALADQQLAGLVMWVPADVVYLAVAVALFLSWLASGSRPVVLPADARAPAVEGSRR